jgi:hypothetical protein
MVRKKVISGPIGENSANLVTLMDTLPLMKTVEHRSRTFSGAPFMTRMQWVPVFVSWIETGVGVIIF